MSNRDMRTATIAMLSLGILLATREVRAAVIAQPPSACSFTSIDVQKSIPDSNTTGIASANSVTSNGTFTSLSLSLNITHTFVGDLVVTLISPTGTSFIVGNRQGGAADNLIINSLPITAFNGQNVAGIWTLRVQDLAAADVGTLNSWSLAFAGGSCRWSGFALPNVPTIDNGTVCTSVNVSMAGGDSSIAKVDFSGSHTYCAILSGTLTHNNTTVIAFPRGALPVGGPCEFDITNRSVPGLFGNSSGTWTFCITDNDTFGDTGVLKTGAVHD